MRGTINKETKSHIGEELHRIGCFLIKRAYDLSEVRSHINGMEPSAIRGLLHGLQIELKETSAVLADMEYEVRS